MSLSSVWDLLSTQRLSTWFDRQCVRMRECNGFTPEKYRKNRHHGKWKKYEIQRETEDSDSGEKLWDVFDPSCERLKEIACWQFYSGSVVSYWDPSNALPCSGCSRHWSCLNIFHPALLSYHLFFKLNKCMVFQAVPSPADTEIHFCHEISM